MNYQERKSSLIAHSKEKNYWYVILVLICFNVLYALYNIIVYFTANSDEVSEVGATTGGIVIGSLVLIFAVQVLYIYGIWRIERWVVIIMWIGLVLSILGLDLINVAITALVLFGYKQILKKIESKPKENIINQD
jgi:hypothetical protein